MDSNTSEIPSSSMEMAWDDMVSQRDHWRARVEAMAAMLHVAIAARDEARWNLCKIEAGGCDDRSRDIARSHGWDYLAREFEPSDTNPETGIQYGDIE